MKVGFLFLHEAAHQVAHSLPVALRLSVLRPDIEVEIFYKAGDGETELAAIAERQPHRCRMTRLTVHSAAARLGERLLGNSVPIGRVALLRENVERFRGLDALVVPEKTSLLLKTRFGLPGLRMIYTSHGAGDRAIGFDRPTGLFDLHLLPGAKVRDRFAEAGYLKPGGYAMVGYPKFDLVPPRAQWPRLFDNDRPTVLYNPHPSPHLSSWYKMGREILDFFAASRDYNLIFAPHVMMFKRRFAIALDKLSIAKTGRVPDEYRRLSHMIIDTGSPASVNMTYPLAADIYLGDASSQVYEFLIVSRPCLFANPHAVLWKDDPNFTHWQFGPVFTEIDELPNTLERAREEHVRYAPIQKRLFDYTFDLDDRPSAARAASAIAAFIDARPTSSGSVG